MLQDLYAHGLIGGGTQQETGWTRPTDWLTVPDLEPTDDKIYLLIKIDTDTNSNFLAFIITGDYTVDWGDGNIENFNSGVKADHQYNWSDIPVETTTSLGYRQALVTITPNGGTIDTIILGEKTSIVTIPGYPNNPILEIVMNCPSATQFWASGTWSNTEFRYLENIIIGENNISDMEGLCSYHTSLKNVEFKADLSHVTNCAYMFAYTIYGDLQIKFGPNAFINCTNFYLMFGYTLIKKIPEFDTSSGINFNGMFTDNFIMEECPSFNTSNGEDFSGMFQNCGKVKKIGNLDTMNGTRFDNMFYYCYSLQNFPINSFDNISQGGNGINNIINQTLICKLPSIDCTNVTSYTNSFAFAKDLKQCDFFNINQTISFQNCQLDTDNIVNVFNNLATVVSKTITITGNPGVPDLTAPDLAIATDKGWTVVT
jgi:hypothetical protein